LSIIEAPDLCVYFVSLFWPPWLIMCQSVCFLQGCGAEVFAGEKQDMLSGSKREKLPRVLLLAVWGVGRGAEVASSHGT
jgi:hypothetical protein